MFNDYNHVISMWFAQLVNNVSRFKHIISNFLPRQCNADARSVNVCASLELNCDSLCLVQGESTTLIRLTLQKPEIIHETDQFTLPRIA